MAKKRKSTTAASVSVDVKYDGLEQVPENALAEGEATGHAHRLSRTPVYRTDYGTRVFSVGDEGDTLTHEEHGPITVAPGDYECGQVREYDHFAEEARTVMD